MNATTTVAVFSPPELKGIPSTKAYSPQELESSVEKEDLEFETIKEDWNEYALEDGTKLHVKPILTLISSTNKYDSHGERRFKQLAKCFPQEENLISNK